MMLIVGFEINAQDVCAPSSMEGVYTLAPWVPLCFPGDMRIKLTEDLSAVLNGYLNLYTFDPTSPRHWESFVCELIVDHEQHVISNGEVGLFTAQQKNFFGIYEDDVKDTIDVDPARISEMRARVTLRAKEIGLSSVVKCIVYGVS